jgi:hypothetical protein
MGLKRLSALVRATPLAENLADPWGIVLAGVAGGAAWAVGIPLAPAAGVAVIVLGVKAAADTLMGRERERSPRRLPVRQYSAEQAWLERAERAVRSFQDLSVSAPAGPLTERCRLMGDQAGNTLGAMHGLAGQVSAVASALARVDASALAGEVARVSAALKAARNAGVRQELEHSLASVRAQLAVHQRLDQASRTLLARMESGALGLEGLVARLAEILALAEAASPVEATQQIDALVDELEGLRSGLAETEDVTRRALSAYREVS